MKKSLVLLASLLLGAASSAFAADATWTNLSGGTWGTAGNWSGSVVAGGTDATANFSTLNITADRTVTLTAPVTIGNLLFADATTPSNNWIVSGSALTLAVTSGAPTIQVTNQAVTFSSALLGTQGFTKTGAGTMLISSTTSSLTGPITVNAGILAGGLAANTFGGITGDITVAAGAGFGFNNISIFNASTYANNIYLSGTGASASFGALELGGNASTTGTITLNADARITHNWNSAGISGPITGSNTSLTLATFQPSQVGVTISGNITLGTGALILNGIGMAAEDLFLTGSNSYSGGTQVNSGALYISSTNALPGWSTGAFRIGSGGTLSVPNAISDSNVATMLSTGTFAAGANFGFNTGAGNRNSSANIADTTGGALGLVKFANNTLTLSGTNTYTGSTVVNAGTLKIGGSNAFGATTTGTLNVASGASLDLNGFNATTGVLAGAGTIGNNSGAGTSTLIVNGTAASAPTLAIQDNLGTAGGKVALTKSGPSTLTLSGTTNTYSGATTVNGRWSVYGQPIGTGNMAGTTYWGNYGTLQLSGSLTSTGTISIANGGVFNNGSTTAASNNGVTNRINTGAILSMGGDVNGGGTFTMVAPAASNIHSQTLAGLVSGTGYNVISSGATTLASGSTALTFTGAGGGGYVRAENSAMNFASGIATTSQTGTATLNSATITMASTAGIQVGQPFSGTGIPAATYVASITNGTTLQLSANATASGTVAMTYSVAASNQIVQFTNAPTAAGGSSVAGTGGNAILAGAILNKTDFIAAAAGPLTAATYTANGATSLTAGANIDVTAQSTTGLTGLQQVNSIRFNDATARTITLSSGTLQIASGGGILAGQMSPRALATGVAGITGGALTSAGSELFISGQNGTDERNNFNLVINSQIVDNGSTPVNLTITGAGSVVLSNTANSFTGNIYLNNGKLAMSGYTAGRTSVTDAVLGGTNTIYATNGWNTVIADLSSPWTNNHKISISSGAMLDICANNLSMITLNASVAGSGVLGIGQSTYNAGVGVAIPVDQSGFTGTYWVGTTFRADEGVGLSSNAGLVLANQGTGVGGVLETKTNFVRPLGNGPGQVVFGKANGNSFGGGFSAVSGTAGANPITVSIGGLGTPQALTWSGEGFFSTLGNGGGNGSGLFLQNGNANNTLTWANPVNNNGYTMYVVQNASTSGTSTAATMTGAITGAGAFQKAGTGLLVLSATNTYTGKTSILVGALGVASIGSVSGTGNLGAPTTAANGTIDIGTGATAATLVYTGTGETTDRVINLAGTTGGATIDQSGSGLLKLSSTLTATGAGIKTLTLQGSTAGTGEIANTIVDNSVTNKTSLTKAGTGTWTLSGTNTYTGVTTVSAGTLLIGKQSALYNTGTASWTPTNIAVAASGTLALALGDSASGYFDSAALDAFRTNMNTSTTTTGFKSSSVLGLDTTNAGGSFTYNSGIGNFGTSLTDGLAKLGSGVLILNGTNTYTGITAVTSGTVQVGSGGTTGSIGTGATSIASGAALVFNRTDNYGGNVSSAMSGSGNLTLLSGSLTLAGASTAFTGTTTVSGGTLLAGVATSAFGSSATLLLNSGTVSLNGFDESVAAISGNADTLITSSTTSQTKTLTVNLASGTSTFAGNIANNGLGKIAFTKTGAGTQVLSGNNTNTGIYNVNGGTLAITGTSDYSGGMTLNGNVNLLVSGNGRLNSSAAVGFNVYSTTGTATATFQDSAVLASTGTHNLAVGANANTRGIVTIKDSASLSWPVGSNIYLGGGGNGAGALIQTGGAVTVPAVLVGANGGAKGYYLMTGGSLTTATRIRIADQSADTLGVVQQLGGSVTTGLVDIVVSAGAPSGTPDATSAFGGTYFMTSGTLTSTGAMTIAYRGGQGDFTLNGGTANILSAGIGAAASNGTGMLNLNGGVLQLGSIFTTAAKGTSYLSFAGGTLKASGASTTFLQGLTLATIQGGYTSGGTTYAGGATIDTNGFAVTIGQSLQAPTGNGVAVDSFTPISGLLGAPFVKVVGNGTGATAQAIYDPATGTMTGITVTNPGNGYTGTPTFQIAGGGLSGTTTINATTFASTSGGLNVTGGGTLTLSGSNNNYTGATTVTGAILTAGTTNAFGSNAPLVVNSGTVNLNGFNQTIGALSGSSAAKITTSSASTLTTSVASGTSTFAGAIIDNGSNKVAFTKAGNGAQELSGNNTFTGPTSVTGGKLIVSGSLSGATTLSVSTGAELNVNGLVKTTSSMTLAGTLSGSGTVGAVTVQSGGVLAPGNSPGVLTTGTLALNAGGSYQLQLNATAGTAGTNWDKVAASKLDLSALDSSNKFTLTLQTLTSGNVNGSLAGFDPAANYTWGGIITFGTLAGSFSANQFTIDTTGFLNTFDGSFSVVQNGSQLDLQYLAIPEPSTWAFMMGGLGMLISLQRMRSRRS